MTISGTNLFLWVEDGVECTESLNEPLARWSEVGHKNYGFNDHVPINLFDSLSIVVSSNDGEKSESQMAKRVEILFVRGWWAIFLLIAVYFCKLK